MTINREAAELMALRLTNAVDAAHTFAEALRLATVALQETREVTEVEPGTAGTATIAAGDATEGGRTFRKAHGVVVGKGCFIEPRPDGWFVWQPDDWADFVPDPDTAALRAEVERLTRLEAAYRGQARGYARQRNEARDDAAREHTRAEAAEARLARVTKTAISDLWVKECGVPGSMAAGFINGVLALVAADEQAAEVRPELITVPYDGHGDDVTCPDCPHSTSHHDPIACGDPSCDC